MQSSFNCPRNSFINSDVLLLIRVFSVNVIIMEIGCRYLLIVNTMEIFLKMHATCLFSLNWEALFTFHIL